MICFVVLEVLEKNTTCNNANNAKFIEADITEYNFKDMQKFYSKNCIRVLVGCAPCQPFSAHNFKIGRKQNDSRWDLASYFIEAIKILKPSIISMENVRGFIKTDVFKNLKEEIKKLKYQIDYDVVNCADYGVPQNRKRLVFLGSKIGEIKIPEGKYYQKKHKTVVDTIKNLSKIKSGETCSRDNLHKALNLSPLNIERIKQSKPNGTWRDWDKKILPDCYKKESGQSYATVYGRMSWDKLAPTITTQFFNYGCGRFGHPKQNRALSLREGALLQTFPKTYDFGNKVFVTKTAKHIGNAVPPELGISLGKAIVKTSNKFIKNKQ